MGYTVFSCRRVVAWRSASVYGHIRTLCRPDRSHENGIHGHHFCSCVCGHALCQHNEQRGHSHGAYTHWICASSRYGKAGRAFDSFRFLRGFISSCSSAIKFYRIQHGSPGAKGFQDRRAFSWNIGPVTGGSMGIICGVSLVADTYRSLPKFNLVALNYHYCQIPKKDCVRLQTNAHQDL